MSIAELLVEKLNVLPPEKQQELLAFAEALVEEAQTKQNTAQNQIWKLGAEPIRLAESDVAEAGQFSNPPLGERLMAIRQQAIENGMQPLTFEEVEQEIAEERDLLAVPQRGKRHRDL